MKLLLLGNPSLPSDNVAFKVGALLEREGFKTRILENPLDLLDEDLEQAVILDAAEGVDEPTLLTNLDRLGLGRLCSLHDFDMAFFMKLLKRLDKLGAVRIIALPRARNPADLLEKTRELLHENT